MKKTFSYDESKALVLARMELHRRPMSTSDIGYTAFPEAKFKSPQGAARAVGRIIKKMLDEKVIDFHWVNRGSVQYKPYGVVVEMWKNSGGCK